MLGNYLTLALAGLSGILFWLLSPLSSAFGYFGSPSIVPYSGG
jgi:hypothetical protein